MSLPSLLIEILRYFLKNATKVVMFVKCEGCDWLCLCPVAVWECAWWTPPGFLEEAPRRLVRARRLRPAFSRPRRLLIRWTPSRRPISPPPPHRLRPPSAPTGPGKQRRPMGIQLTHSVTWPLLISIQPAEHIMNINVVLYSVLHKAAQNKYLKWKSKEELHEWISRLNWKWSYFPSFLFSLFNFSLKWKFSFIHIILNHYSLIIFLSAVIYNNIICISAWTLPLFIFFLFCWLSESFLFISILLSSISQTHSESHALLLDVHNHSCFCWWT